MPRRRDIIDEPEETLSQAERDELQSRLADLPEETHSGGLRPKKRPSSRRTVADRNPAGETSGHGVREARATGQSSPGSTWKLALAVLALSVSIPGTAAYLFFASRSPYEYSHSQGIYWRVNRNTGIRETATKDGWKTDAQIDASRTLSLATLSVSARNGRLSCSARFEPSGDPMLAPNVPALRTTLTLNLEIPSPNPEESTADRKLKIRLVDRDGVGVAETAIPLAAFRASQDGHTLVCEHAFAMTEDDFHRIASWTAKANWQTILVRVGAKEVPVTWGLDHNPTPGEIKALENSLRARVSL
ncbi:MAG TPA: hypothetical protein VMI31_06315 [Fimbriimonadaceae bacterium]|nr:hypothetical protein [Fimbriimonadaceae bacterium]